MAGAMFPSVAEAFPRVTRPLEGCVLYPYLDVFGIPTEGYGCAEQSLAEFRKVAWSEPQGDVAAQYAALKARPKARHFSQYENATSLRLTQEAADDLLRSRADVFAAYMREHYFSEWDSWPADGQLAWMLLAWACGPGAPGEFTTAAALAKKRDWATMRKWARINPGKPGQANWNPGVVPRNAQIDLCLANAAAIDSQDGYATPALYWPGPVLDAPQPTHEEADAAQVALASFSIEECGLTGHCHQLAQAA